MKRSSPRSPSRACRPASTPMPPVPASRCASASSGAPGRSSTASADASRRPRSATSRRWAWPTPGRPPAPSPSASRPAPLPSRPQPHPRAAVLTLGGLIDRYERHRRRKGGKGMKSLDEAMRTVRRGLDDYLKLPATQFSKADLRAARDVIAARAPTAANRFQAYLGPVLGWADSEDLIPHDFSRAVIRVGREVKRDRVLTARRDRRRLVRRHELGDSLPAQNFGRMVRFLIGHRPAPRRGANMRHGDLLGGVWRLAAEHNKAGREHRLKLPPLALDQIGTGEARDSSFPARRQRTSARFRS